MLPTFEKASDNIKYLDSIINKKPVILPQWESKNEERLVKHQATEAWVFAQRTNGVFGTTNRKRQCTKSTNSSKSNNSTITIDEASELTPPRNDERSVNEASELTPPRNDERSDDEAIELAPPSNDEKSDISSLLRSSSPEYFIDSPEAEPLDFERNYDSDIESNHSIEIQVINVNPAPQDEDIQTIYHVINLQDSDTEESSESNIENISV